MVVKPRARVVFIYIRVRDQAGIEIYFVDRARSREKRFNAAPTLLRKFNGRMRKVLFSRQVEKRAGNLIPGAFRSRKNRIPAASSGIATASVNVYLPHPTSLMRLRPTKSRVYRGEKGGGEVDVEDARNNLTRRWRIRVFGEKVRRLNRSSFTHDDIISRKDKSARRGISMRYLFR